MTPIDADGPRTPTEVRSRYLKRIDVRAAVLVAAVFNAILGVAFTLAGWVVVAVAAQRGFLDQVNSVTSDLSSSHHAGVSAVRLCVIWALIVMLWAITMTVVVALATSIFNAVLQLLGGIELDLRATRPERLDAEAVVRGFAQSALTRVRALTPHPVVGEARAASAVREVTGGATVRDPAPTNRSGPDGLRSRKETVTSR